LVAVLWRRQALTAALRRLSLNASRASLRAYLYLRFPSGSRVDCCSPLPQRFTSPPHAASPQPLDRQTQVGLDAPAPSYISHCCCVLPCRTVISTASMASVERQTHHYHPPPTTPPCHFICQGATDPVWRLHALPLTTTYAFACLRFTTGAFLVTFWPHCPTYPYC